MSVFFKKYRNFLVFCLFIFIFIMLLFLFFFLFQNTNDSLDEAFQQNSNSNSNIKNILFLGDSILNNQSYVSSGETVQDLLKKQHSSFNVLNYAQDGATISSVYQQIKQIPEYLNSTDSVLFLSIGGNDILSTLLKEENKLKQDIYLSILFEKYQILLETIHEKMNLSQIYIMDIYYPIHPYFQPWILFIKKWNYLLENNKLSIPVIKISTFLNESSDFVDFIEPSKRGGEKIADILFSCIA